MAPLRIAKVVKLTLALPLTRVPGAAPEREIFSDNLLVRIHLIIVMIWWTGLAPWDSEFPFPGSLTSTFLSTGFQAQLQMQQAQQVQP